jgi:hypothetical protein
MTNTTQQEMERRAEFTLPTACVACSGDLAVRVTPGKAFAYCPKCHWLSKPHVEILRDGFRVGPAIAGLA